MPEIGAKVRFVPHAFSRSKEQPMPGAVLRVTGTVAQIHAGHRWYRVEYRLPGVAWPCYECFKF